MRGTARASSVFLLVLLTASCAGRVPRPVATLDPAPYLDAVRSRQAVLSGGLSGTLELSYRGEQRFKGKVYTVVFPDGRFRLDVPGPFGGTRFVMASDGREIVAFYPDRDRAFRSAVNGHSLSPYLPFPLPVETGWLPALFMGALPRGAAIPVSRARLMDSGEKELQAPVGAGRLRFTWLFSGEENASIRQIFVRSKDLDVQIRTRRDDDDLPRSFKVKLKNGTLDGEWDRVSRYNGDDSALRITLPASVMITDLEGRP